MGNSVYSYPGPNGRTIVVHEPHPTQDTMPSTGTYLVVFLAVMFVYLLMKGRKR